MFLFVFLKEFMRKDEKDPREKSETPVLHRTPLVPRCTPRTLLYSTVLHFTPLVLYPYSGVMKSRFFPLGKISIFYLE